MERCLKKAILKLFDACLFLAGSIILLIEVIKG
jgi:hypothetical protein